MLNKKFRVFVDDFYRIFKSEICKEEISNLMARYHIYGKKLASVGCGTAHEEYWFQKIGQNTLTLIDIDEQGGIEKKLQTIKNDVLEESKEVIDYYIADFRRCKQVFRNAFDVLYFSSFTPDELRRDRISKNYQKWGKYIAKITANLNRKIFGKTKTLDLNWPVWRTPFHESIYHSLDLLKDQGLLIIQSYCGGIDLRYNADYVNKVKQEFLKRKLILLDIYYLEEAPAVVLLVAFRGEERMARNFYKNIAKVSLDKFHGRTTLNKKAVHLYSLGNT